MLRKKSFVNGQKSYEKTFLKFIYITKEFATKQVLKNDQGLLRSKKYFFCLHAVFCESVPTYHFQILG